MHSTRGRIRNNLHVQCSVCSLWGTLLLCLWVQVKLKPISIYLFGCTHTDLISLFHSCLLVMTDATYCLVRMGVTIYRWSMNVVVGHPLERLPCFGSQRKNPLGGAFFLFFRKKGHSKHLISLVLSDGTAN